MHVELDCKEEDVESCQVSTVCLPTSCVSLLREHYKQIANRNGEHCSEESIKGKIDDTNPFADPEVFPLSHLETTQSEIENKSTPLGSLPLCFGSFQIIKINWHPENLLKATHESHAQSNYHENQEELIEDETNQEMKEHSQDLSK